MDSKTGAVLAMVNKPSLDLNDLPRDDLALLNSRSRNSLVIDIYEPGSTFKIFTAAAQSSAAWEPQGFLGRAHLRGFPHPGGGRTDHPLLGRATPTEDTPIRICRRP